MVNYRQEDILDFNFLLIIGLIKIFVYLGLVIFVCMLVVRYSNSVETGNPCPIFEILLFLKHL